jgi:hypothetical protein
MNLFRFAIGTYFTSESVNFNIVKREIRMLPDDPETIAGLYVYHCRSFDTSRHQTPSSYEKIEHVQRLYVNRLSSPLHVEGWFQNRIDRVTTATLRPAPMGIVKKVLLTYRQPRAKTLRVISLSSAATYTHRLNGQRRYLVPQPF